MRRIEQLSLQQAGVVLHWDGNAWTVEQQLEAGVAAIWVNDPAHAWVAPATGLYGLDGGSLVFGGVGSASALSGTSPADVWATGGNGTWHFDGGEWGGVGTGLSSSRYGIQSIAPDDVWAVGELGLIAHWDGLRWSAQNSGTVAKLNGIWASSADDVWIVGAGSEILRRGR